MIKETYIILSTQPEKGLEVFYNRYGKKLYAYAVQNWKLDEDNTWDLIYKTFTNISEKIDRYSFVSEEKFGSFVLVTFLNNLRNFYRDAKKNIEVLPEEHINFQLAYEDDEDFLKSESERMRILKEELEKLEDWERMLLLLKAQQMPYSEIARYVDKPENQLKVYYARLKKKIAETIILKTEVHHA